VRRTLAGGLELDDDRERIDVEAVHGYLSKESYWASSRSREAVEQTVREAARVVGLYDGARQVGFARVVSDNVHMAYLADVYVLTAYRGNGLGVELVREAIENGPHRELGWTLATHDAHGLYTRFGFGPSDYRWMARPKPS
jgi:GNAT superfamily N-acetyltransferase